VIASRLVGVAMHLAHLLERRWPPYAKWRGSVLATLPAASATVAPLLTSLRADRWQDREEGLCAAADLLLDVQRGAGLPVPAGAGAVEPFHGRPYRGVRGGIEEALLAAVRDTEVRALPRGVGSVEQWSDNVAVLTAPRLRSRP
jgi:hypothetical protein